jgi:stage V sporulation protein AD
MTFYYNNVYISCCSTVAGPYEKNGPLGKYFDKTYDNFYIGERSFEKAEIKLVKESIGIIRKKLVVENDFDIVIGGDLMNQITASTYGCCGVGKSFIGVYGACSSSVLECSFIS